MGFLMHLSAAEQSRSLSASALLALHSALRRFRVYRTVRPASFHHS